MKKQNILKIVFLLFFFSLPLFASTEVVSGGSLLSILSAAFVAGILLTFTPCVLPMVPILSSVIAGEGEKISKVKAFWLSFAYILGTATTYAFMGALAGGTGEQLQSYFQNTWAIGTMSLIFVFMALAMFGLISVQLPASLQTRLDVTTHNLKGGKFFAVFSLGLVSALVLGACVSPVLISFLSVAIATSNPLLGAQTMSALALGMGLPLLLIGVGAGYLLPKVGAWMDSVKYFFGVLLLGVAISIFSELQLLSSLFLWGIYFIGIAVYLGAIDFTVDVVNGWRKLQKLIAILLLLWGTIMLIGAAKGGKSFYVPLQTEPTQSLLFPQSATLEDMELPFERIKNLKEFQVQKEKALHEHKPMIIYFHAEHCKVCEKLKNTTLRNQKVREKLKDYIALMVDMTDKSDEAASGIKKRLKIFGPPAFIMIDVDGTLLDDEILYGYQSANELFDTLDLNAE